MQQCFGKVVQSAPLAKELHMISVQVPKEAWAAATPGQCAHIRVPGDEAHLLRRPISILSLKDGLLHMAIQPKGEGTKRINAAPIGSMLDLIFPFGKGFRAEGAKRIYLVGGGVGVAPMQCCAEAFAAGRDVRAYFGYRAHDYVYGAQACEEAGCPTTICTDDGSLGVHGLVTVPLVQAIQKDKPDLIMACGPGPMLRAVKQIAQEYGVAAQVSMEQRMGCGIGACLTCTCASSWGGNMRVCVDGPVFDAEEVAL